MIVPAMLGVYALAFIAGGIYYLEQRAARMRDLFPKYGPLAQLIGWTALGIGLLAAISRRRASLGPGHAVLATARWWPRHPESAFG